MRLRDRVALVTGAGSGIGRAIALLFAREGARVAVADRDEQGGEQTALSIRQQGGAAVHIVADVSRGVDVRRMVATTLQAFRWLDILINNAGIAMVGSVETLTEEEWDRTMGVNLKSVFLSSKYAIPHLRKQRASSIVHISSVNAIRPFANRDAYSASKGALLSLTKGMALELAADNIRVNCICPGTVDTPILQKVADQLPLDSRPTRLALADRQPLGRLGTPEEVAQAALYLVSDEAAFITGSILVIDGGMSL